MKQLRKIVSFLKRNRHHAAWHDLALTSGLATLALLLVLTGLPRSLIMPLTIPLVLVLPGYAMLTALFPHPELDRPTRLLLSVSLSVTLTVLIGLVINRLPLGLRTGPWAITLWFVTIAGAIIALLRRMFARPLDLQVQKAGLGLVTVWQGLRMDMRQLGLVGVAVLISGAALLLAQYEAQRQPPTNTMQLWLLPAAEEKHGTLKVGLASIGSAQGAFKLLISRDGVTLRQWSLTIKPGERWEEQVYVAPGLITQAIDAQLYRADEPGKAYRWVRFWLNP